MRGPARPCGLRLLLLAFLAASCGPGLADAPASPRSSAPPAETAPVGVGADQVVPLTSGPAAFSATQSLLAAAARFIHLEMYEFQRADLAALVLRAHRRGASATAIMDPSERSSRSLWAELEQGGVRVVAFPVEPQSIDHVKLLIVDGERAIIGGINWGRHSEANRDYDVLVSGPVVANLERVFSEDLALAGQPAMIPSPSPDALVQVLVTRPGEAIRAAVLDAIARARSRIDIEMFVLTDPQVLEALGAAVRRGVVVRVLLEPGQSQNTDARKHLAAAGAQARFFRARAGEKLHAKTGVFDAATVIFGSCNWTRSGFARNHELDLLIADPGIARAFLAGFESDWAQSR